MRNKALRYRLAMAFFFMHVDMAKARCCCKGRDSISQLNKLERPPMFDSPGVLPLRGSHPRCFQGVIESTLHELIMSSPFFAWLQLVGIELRGALKQFLIGSSWPLVVESRVVEWEDLSRIQLCRWCARRESRIHT